MQLTLRRALGLALFLATTCPCLALMAIAHVTPARAKELGITLRSNPNGDAGVAVRLEFKPVGVLKNFTRVELRLASGGQHLVSAPLQTKRTADGTVEAWFSAAPEQLAGSTLLIAVTDAPRSHYGYAMAVKDFIVTEPAR